jgi:hypothetical protein
VPPPLPPGAVVVKVVQVRYIVAGDVASFNAAAFKASLAAHLPGVNEADISIEVSAASVTVTATIAAPAAQTVAALTALAADTDLASSTLGVTVEATSTPEVTRMITASPSSAGLSQGALIGIVVAAAVVALLTFAVGICCCRRRSRGGDERNSAGTKEENGIGYSSSTLMPPLEEAESVPQVHLEMSSGAGGLSTERV